MERNEGAGQFLPGAAVHRGALREKLGLFDGNGAQF